MIKSSKTVVLVDSVETAVKFYTEKLAFDVVDLEINKEENEHALAYALLRKGKCYILFKIPRIEELAEFSFIKRCASRCVGIFSEIKKGLDKYFAKCAKKGVTVINEPEDCTESGFRMFSIKDPFGLKLTFAEPLPDFKEEYKDFAGLEIHKAGKEDTVLIEEMVKHLKTFGILRRASKKFAKLWLKNSKK